MRRHFLTLLLGLSLAMPAAAADGNRLTYLDANELYYASHTFPKLTTPQWVGEAGVDAVVVFAIDDMRGPERWEKFLRPILQRLKQIDGRAPVSIMTCQVDPKHPHLQTWLREGLSLETHTIDHPCPLLKDGDFAKAKSTFDRCVDMMWAVPNSRPVAFRVPCCDSLNTPSPRFYAEIFNRTTPAGHFLRLDSSVFNVFTEADPELPRELLRGPDGGNRFKPYFPAGRSFVNWVENYPYPFVIGRLCWEFPCVTPSDWEAQFRQKPANPLTLRDWQADLDLTVTKQGVFDLVYHPYGWSTPEQHVALIDYAVKKYGKRVKFLTFREARERLLKHLLGGVPLRAADGSDNGVRLLDVNNDGFMDVVIGNSKVRQTRIWRPRSKTWKVSDFPAPVAGVRFGVLRKDGNAAAILRTESAAGAWQFDGSRWIEDKSFLNGLAIDGKPILTQEGGRDRGVRLRDLDGDGICELIVGNESQNAIFCWGESRRTWVRLPFALPWGVSVVDAAGHDAGLRFVDLDEDGRADVVFAGEQKSVVALFAPSVGQAVPDTPKSQAQPDLRSSTGWSRIALLAKAGERKALPPFVRHGTDNGAFFHSHHLWWQNESTALLRDHVDRRSFNELLGESDPVAKPPKLSLEAMGPRPGFRVEQMVTEPLVQDPIAFAWGPDGKLWVVEMGDYPLGIDGKGKPGGRVKFLESTRGDGHYDKATVFLDHLGFPTGVMPWRKGVLITCAPDILYAEDTKGTGKADVVKKLFTGFREGNQQHRVNGLLWGLDNWIYGANGDSGGRIRSVKTGAVVDISGRDFRFRPDTGEFETVTGGSQYGRGRNDWGDWFGGNNSNPIWHFALRDHYLRRNPHLAPPNPRVALGPVPGAAPVFPVSRTLPRFNDPEAANHFTSACSPSPYRDDLFGRAFANSVFVCEPVHNLVSRLVLAPDGTTFTGRRANDEQHREFLASRDNWFRPTMVKTGPDGALWVTDMYRAVIEHPQWIPPDWQKRLDLRAGHDLGRIYRVYPDGATPRPIPRLDHLDTAELVAALDSPSGWQRDMVQQMLLWRNDRSAAPLLEKLAAECPRPRTRLHALCTLDGLGTLTPSVLLRALKGDSPGVRRHAVRLCEGHFQQSADLGPALLKLVDDADAQVRLQLAYTLGDWNDPRAGEALGRLAVRNAGDRFLFAAVLSSANATNLEPLWDAALGESCGEPPPQLVADLLRLATAIQQPQTVARLLTAIGTASKGQFAPWQFAATVGLLDALEVRGSSLAKLAGSDPQLRVAVAGLNGLFVAARQLAANDSARPVVRVPALPLLARGPNHREEDLTALAGLLAPREPDEVQRAAAAALGRLRDPRAAGLMLRAWKSFSPATRLVVLDALLARHGGAETLLAAIARKDVLPAEIDAPRRQRLLRHPSAAIRKRAATVFAESINPNRQKVVDAFRAALSLPGNAERGKVLFAKHCATCHRLGGVGNEVGPDLASLGDKSSPALLIAVLDPNRAVEARYVQYQAETKDGRLFSGVLTAETGTSVTLTGVDGKPQTILRQDLESLRSTGLSAMPEGLEKDLSAQDLADLFVHVRGAKKKQ